MKLPKLFIKKLYGDATVWQQFKVTFETAVNTNENISDVERFTYLRSYLGGEAEKYRWA